MRKPYREGKVHVLDGKCDTCIFRPGNLMRLREGRVEEMVEESIADGGAIICHKTLDDDQAVCRGFFDVHKHDVQALQVAERLSMVVFSSPPTKGDA